MNLHRMDVHPICRTCWRSILDVPGDGPINLDPNAGPESCCWCQGAADGHLYYPPPPYPLYCPMATSAAPETQGGPTMFGLPVVINPDLPPMGEIVFGELGCPQVGYGGRHSEAYYDDGACAWCGAKP